MGLDMNSGLRNPMAEQNGMPKEQMFGQMPQGIANPQQVGGVGGGKPGSSPLPRPVMGPDAPNSDGSFSPPANVSTGMAPGTPPVMTDGVKRQLATALAGAGALAMRRRGPPRRF